MIELLAGLDINSVVTSFFSQASQSQIAQAGFFFTLAAWIHSGRVKKEISKNFGALTAAINNVATTSTAAINNVATTLSDELKSQAKILANHGQRLETLESKNINQGEANV